MPTHCARRLAPLLAAALAAGPLGAQAITPRFDWKPGQSARITTTLSYRAESADGSEAGHEEQVLHHVDHIRVDPDPRGLALVWSGAQTRRRTDGPVPQEHDPAADPMRRAGVIVDARGRMIAFRDTAQLRVFTDSTKTAMLERFTDLPAQTSRMLSYAHTPAAMGARVNTRWYEDVGQWLERSWSPRDSLVDSLALPSAPGATGRALARRRVRWFDGEVPCPHEHRGRCWSFTETTHIGGSGVVPAMQAQIEAFGLPEMTDALAEMGDLQVVITTVRIVDAHDFRPLLRRETIVTSSSAPDAGARIEALRTYRWE